MTMPIDGGTPTKLVTPTMSGDVHLAVDAHHVYWTFSVCPALRTASAQ
jgi:hypothetical protein